MQYSSAPITEAVFDIKVEELVKPDINEIEQLLLDEYVRLNFPKNKKQFNLMGTVEFHHKEGKFENQNKASTSGTIFLNNDETRQFQARLDGFTFNMLSPYTNWDDFSIKAFEAWSVYRKICKPQKINRLALRYINRILLPISFSDFNDYITNMPPIPNSLPQKFNAFFMQTHVPYHDPQKNIIITETIEQIQGEFLPLILDIDVFQIGVFEEDNLRNIFEDLRVIKNEVFENCITQKARELFK